MSGVGAFAGKTILYVEDDPIIAFETLERLKNMGFGRLLYANDLCRADQLKLDHKIDVAFLDVHVGLVSTIELAHELADAGAHIVFTSAYSRDELGDRLGEFPFLPKPYLTGDLSVALEDTLEDKSGNLAAE